MPVFVWLAAASAQEPALAPDPGAITIGQVSFSAGDAGKVLTVDVIRGGGAELRDLRCTGVAGGLLGPAVLGAALGAVGPALHACAPGGWAGRLGWTWAGGAPSALVVTPPSACVQAAFAKAAGAPTWTAACTVVLLAAAPGSG
jgi:hypothetical protein